MVSGPPGIRSSCHPLIFIEMPFSFLLYFPLQGQIFEALLFFCIANIGFEMGGIYLNAYLPEIAPKEKAKTKTKKKEVDSNETSSEEETGKVKEKAKASKAKTAKK